MRKSGYCKMCLKNVPHTFRLTLFRGPDRLLLGLLTKMGFGSWYCEGCNQQSTFLPAYRKDVQDFFGMEPAVEKKKPRREKKSKSPSLDSAPTGVDDLLQSEPKLPQEPIGNVLRSDDSLLVRKARASRYSAKFRQSVVSRILSGQTTIKQIRGELKLSERDLLDWIADADREKDDRIIELNQTIRSIKSIGWEGQYSENPIENPIETPIGESVSNESIETPIEDATIIDGRVNPK